MIGSGPALQRRGAIVYSNNNVSTGIDVVSAAANVNGILVRTILLYTSVAARFLSFQAGGADLFYISGQKEFIYCGPGLVIPPGLAMRVGGNSAAPGEAAAFITYDLP